jgi:hypothetical protein
MRDRAYQTVGAVSEGATRSPNTQGIHRPPDEDLRRVHHAASRDAIEARLTGGVLPGEQRHRPPLRAHAGRTKRTAGHPPSVIDTRLAASAIEAQLYLVTHNDAADFHLTGML